MRQKTNFQSAGPTSTYNKILQFLAIWLFLQASGASASDLPNASPTAASGQSSPVHASESADAAKGALPAAKIEILFGGSLCPVCLVAFEKRLTATDGVLSAHVEALNTAKHTGHPPKRAQAIIEFVPGKITQARLIEMVKNNDFQFLKAQELQAPSQ